VLAEPGPPDVEGRRVLPAPFVLDSDCLRLAAEDLEFAGADHVVFLRT
jgi:hypothetical protein